MNELARWVRRHQHASKHTYTYIYIHSGLMHRIHHGFHRSGHANHNQDGLQDPITVTSTVTHAFIYTQHLTTTTTKLEITELLEQFTANPITLGSSAALQQTTGSVVGIHQPVTPKRRRDRLDCQGCLKP
jgi:hypothetical protein